MLSSLPTIVGVGDRFVALCPARRSVARSGADDDGRRGAEPRRLRQLALERAPGVVGVGTRRPRARSSASQRVTSLPRRARRRARRRRRGSRRVGRDAGLLEREQQALDPGAEADARRRRAADLLDEAVVAAAAGDGRVLRSPSARRTPTSCGCSSRGRGRASARARRRRRSRRGPPARRRSARRTPRRATRRSSAPRRARPARPAASRRSCRTRAAGSSRAFARLARRAGASLAASHSPQLPRGTRAGTRGSRSSSARGGTRVTPSRRSSVS